MSSYTFTNGLGFSSSALDVPGIETIFQALLLQIFGITVDPKNPSGAWSQVLVGWQQQGQPTWLITEDKCIVTAYPLNDEDFGKVRDQVITANNDVSVGQQMMFTRVWRIHFTLYGPNCFKRASLIVSAMSLDWVRQILENPPNTASHLYMLAKFDQPTWNPENFQRQWWPRTDLDLRFNEQVGESTTVSSAVSSQITLITDQGTEEVIDLTTS